MVSEDYIKIIKDGLLQSARDMGMGRWRWIFQQDNDPKVRFTVDLRESGLITDLFTYIFISEALTCGQNNYQNT